MSDETKKQGCTDCGCNADDETCETADDCACDESGCGCGCGTFDPNASVDELTALRALTEQLVGQLEQAKDERLRAAAELDNFRKRMQRETEDKIRYANQSIIAEMLPALDNLDMALMHGTQSTVENLYTGVDLTRKSFLDILSRFGLTTVEVAVGSPFDPATMDALMLDNDEQFEDNAVTFVLQKGYSLSGRVIRPAKVKVNRKG